MQIRWIVLGLIVLAGACDKKNDQAAATMSDPAKMTDDQIIAAGFQVMLDMSKISEATTGDCDRAAAELGAFVDRHEAMILAFQRVTTDQAKKAEVVRAHEKEIRLIRDRSIPLQENCGDHEQLRAVFARLVP